MTTIPFARHQRPLALTAIGMMAVLAGQALANDGVAITKGDGKVTVTIDGKLFTEYLFKGHSKPILYPIIGPHGITMTRHYPMKEDVDNEARDHPHQKSLWFTHGDVNGVNFWLEYPKPEGLIVQQSLEIVGNGIRTTDDWKTVAGKMICSDTRNICFGKTAVGPYIDYQVAIHASAGDVTFVDTKEGMMGIRTNPLLRLRADKRRGNHTAKGQALNSTGTKGAEIWGQRADWVDYWAPIQGHTVGIAIFDHPSNPRHPTWWHARTYGLVAANPVGIHDFEKKPQGTGNMLIKAGTTVTFRYRFLFHEGDAQKADVAGQYERFAQSTSGAK